MWHLLENMQRENTYLFSSAQLWTWQKINDSHSLISQARHFFSLSQRVLSESELVIMRVRFEARLGKNVLWPLIKVKEILACWEQNVSLQDRNHMPGVGAKPMDAGSFFVDGLIDCTHKP